MQYHRLRTGLSGPHWRAVVAVPLVLAVLLPLWWMAGRVYEGQLLLEKRAQVNSDLTTYAYALTEEFHERYAVLAGLRAFALTSVLTGAPEAGFSLWAAEAFPAMQDLRAIWIAPGGVVCCVYPLAGNEDLLGRNVIEDDRPGVREDIEGAIQSRHATLSDQYDQGMGSPDWIAWMAVHRDDDVWGLVGMRLDPTEILGIMGLRESSHWLQLALRDDAGEIIYGSQAVFEGNPVVLVLDRPEAGWELAAVPKEGWTPSVRGQLQVFETGGLVIVVLLVSLAYLNAAQYGRLARAVKQGTQEVARINQELREDIARREEVEAEHERLLEELEQRVAERTHHLKTLYDVTAVANASLDLHEILERSLDRIVAAVDSASGLIHLFDPCEGRLRLAACRNTPYEPCSQIDPSAKNGKYNGSYCWICGSNERLAVANTATDAAAGVAFRRLGALAYVGTPIWSKGQLTGMLCLFRQLDRPFSAEEEALLVAISEQLGVAVENARLFDAAQNAATLEERQRLAHELHDSVAQLIYSDVLLAEAARGVLACGDLAAAEKYLARTGETAQQALKEMRLLCFELRPSGLAQEGLVVALQRRLDAVEKRAGLAAELLVDGAIDLPPSVQVGLYRVACEALNNALKYAAATSVTIELRARGDLVEMMVSDDGRGFDPSNTAHRGGLGLMTMHERVRGLRGSLAIDSTPGIGTIVQVKVPLGQDSSFSQSSHWRDGLGEVSALWKPFTS
ncbi:MAG: histidine kinase [Dehalococcoidia bacterium]|nr:histidine kinase [Dehalococcoidia bacterium]